MHKLTKNAMYCKTMKNLGNRIKVTKKDYLKQQQNQVICRKKLFESHLVTIKLRIKLHQDLTNQHMLKCVYQI